MAAIRRTRDGFGGRATLAIALAASPLVALLTIPLVALVTRTPVSRFVESLSSTTVLQAIGLSFATSTITTVLAIALGTPLGYLLGRARLRGRSILDTLVELPMILPPSVAGVALLLAFGRRGLLGSYLQDAGLDIAFTTTAVVLAQLFVASPFYVKAAAGAFEQIDRSLEETAATLGAGPWRVFQMITVPLVRPSLMAGAVMTWARALGEFGATIIFAGNYPGRTQTMPLAIYIGFELDLTAALTLAVVLLACSFVILGAVKVLLSTQGGRR